MSIFVDLKRVFYGKDEVDTELNKKLEKTTLKNLNNSSPGIIFTNNQDDWLDITTENGSYTLSTQSSSPYDSTISLSNFKGTIRFKLKGNKGSMNLKTSALSNDLSYGEEGDVTHNFTTANTYVDIQLNPYSDFLINCSSPLTLDITYNVSFWGRQMNNIADMIYPIGSIYMSCNNTDPMYLFGGRWEHIKDKFLLSAGDTYANGTTGGSATVTLTSAQSGLKAHGHGMDHNHNHRHSLNKNFSTGSGSVSAYTVSSNRSTSTQYTGYDSTASSKKTTDNNTAENASQAHENMPPYLTVYMWKRIG